MLRIIYCTWSYCASKMFSFCLWRSFIFLRTGSDCLLVALLPRAVCVCVEIFTSLILTEMSVFETRIKGMSLFEYNQWDIVNADAGWKVARDENGSMNVLLSGQRRMLFVFRLTGNKITSRFSGFAGKDQPRCSFCSSVLVRIQPEDPGINSNYSNC